MTPLALQGDKRFQSLVIEVELIGFVDEVKINAISFSAF
jgi:hypothetical protein